MSFLTKLLPYGGVIETVLDRLFPDPAEKARAQLAVMEMEQKGELAVLESDKAQAAINQAEASSASLFVSGWRPAVGWICAMGLFAQYVGAPLLTWIASNLLGWTAPPRMDMSELSTLLIGMLGLGYFRTREKLSAR